MSVHISDRVWSLSKAPRLAPPGQTGKAMSGDYREPYYDTGQTAVYLGDVRDVLRALPAESVNCVVTSPPYWSLRDYGINPSIWGGDAECAHEWGAGQVVTVGNAPSATKSTLTTNNGRGPLPGNKYSSDNTSEVSTGQFCGRCDAWRGALGLEPTPALFVAHMVEVFREVRRVLRPDGTAWVNLGDSYAGGGQGPTGVNGFGNHEERQGYHTPKRRHLG